MTEEIIEKTKADLESKGLWFEVPRTNNAVTEAFNVICRQCKRPGKAVHVTTPETRAANLYRSLPDLCFECIAENDDEADGLIDGTIY